MPGEAVTVTVIEDAFSECNVSLVSHVYFRPFFLLVLAVILPGLNPRFMRGGGGTKDRRRTSRLSVNATECDAEPAAPQPARPAEADCDTDAWGDAAWGGGVWGGGVSRPPCLLLPLPARLLTCPHAPRAR